MNPCSACATPTDSGVKKAKTTLALVSAIETLHTALHELSSAIANHAQPTILDHEKHDSDRGSVEYEYMLHRPLLQPGDASIDAVGSFDLPVRCADIDQYPPRASHRSSTSHGALNTEKSEIAAPHQFQLTAPALCEQLGRVRYFLKSFLLSVIDSGANSLASLRDKVSG